MIAPAGQSTARACLRSKLAALVVRRQAGPATWGLHAPKSPNKEVGRPTGYANAVLLFALNACGPSSVFKFGCSPEPPQGEKGPLVKGGRPRQRTGGFRRAVRCNPFPSGRRSPPRGVGDAAPYNDLARLLIAANGHGGLGAGRPTSHFSTVRRAGCPHPAAASPLPPVFGSSRTKSRGSHARAPLPLLLLQYSYFPASSTASTAFST